jgi:hypothetical protein
VADAPLILPVRASGEDANPETTAEEAGVEECGVEEADEVGFFGSN